MYCKRDYPLFLYITQINGGSRPSSSASSDHTATDGLRQPSGTLTSLIRKSLHWPLHVGRTLFGSPRQLARWMYKAARAVGLHIRERQEDYVFLYELLSLGVPFIYVLHEITSQMSREAVAPSPVSMM